MYSNCLIEALKAKIKDPKNVRIIGLPPKINKSHWHFFWVRGNVVQHFEEDGPDEGKKPIFKGVYKESDLETFEALFLRKIMKQFAYDKNDVIVHYAKKFKLPSTEKEGFLNWTRYWPEEGLDNKPTENKICKYVMVMTEDKNLEVVAISDFANRYKTCDWKYMSPYCQEWLLLGSKG